ncbi:MAG: DJ-1/PfpI family protein [Deltaproteobacteria bacterium]|jgi:4-methyl-5(b-hydroxyethyl)-thiazole monophosphate biosynthesis|nr:DJ-1/PfpI family protein [Deltaproteobacteria bacterium]
MSEQVVVVLATGFEEIEAATPIDVLRRAGVDVVVAGVGSTAVQGAHGVTYQCDSALEDILSTPRAIVLPGGLPGAENLGKSGAVKEMALKVNENGGICAAICAAPALTLAKYGVLNDRTATCYPSFEKEFDSSTKPSEDRVVVDGNIITSRGPGTSLEFSLKLAAMLVGQEAADEIQDQMLARV